MLIETELLAQIWVNGEDDDDLGSLERCVIEIERTDPDEVRIGIRESEDVCTHVYMARDRVLRFAHALIEQALKEYGGG